jgi:serine/threonine protein phosphatase 1
MFYAIGDVHGQIEQLDRALALIEADGGPDAEIFFVGDLVDRGPDSRGVIQRLIDGQASGKYWSCILGNHDLMFHQFVNHGIVSHSEIKSGKTWLHKALGGVNTLASYMDGVDIDHPDWPGWEAAKADGLDPASPSLIEAIQDAAKAHVPLGHLNWIASMSLFAEGPMDVIFVHAGIRPGVQLRDQAQSDLIWIREGWLDHTAPHKHMYVHGHTALEFPQHHGNRINIDGGAGYGRPLVPVAFDGTDWFTLDESGRTPLVP